MKKPTRLEASAAITIGSETRGADALEEAKILYARAMKFVRGTAKFEESVPINIYNTRMAAALAHMRTQSSYMWLFFCRNRFDEERKDQEIGLEVFTWRKKLSRDDLCCIIDFAGTLRRDLMNSSPAIHAAGSIAA